MGSEEIRQKLLGKFREVTADRVERIATALLQLEKGPAPEAGREIARELHTLKGESRMMGFLGISQVVHAAEELLPTVATERAGPCLDALLHACGVLPVFLDGKPEGGDETQALVAKLRALAGGAPPPEPANTAREAPSAPLTAGPGGAGGLRRPARKPAAPEPARAAPAPDATPGASTTIRVDVEALDRIGAMVGDLLVDGARSRVRARDLSELLQRWSGLSDRALAMIEATRTADSAPEIDALEDDLYRLRGENFRFLRSHGDAVDGSRESFGLLAERVGEARLVPLAEIFGRFPLAAREFAREQGKQVDCHVLGGETGVDRAILLSLSDPLVHLLRNAVDHGLESPDERRAAGKEATGTITISARTDGDLLALTLEDDGRGVDPELIRASAVQRGLLPAEQAAALSERAALDLIFIDGFSTKVGASETSGRGVGLDVVRRKVVSLGGSVMVDSTPGKGSRFTLRLPQSLALMKVLLFRLDDDIYGLPAMDVEGVGRIDPSEVTEIAGIRTIRHRDRLMPVVGLGPLLSLNGGVRARRAPAAFVTHGDDAAALVVDGFVDEREVAVKAPGEFLKGMRFVSGAAALEDGRVALLLSTSDLVAAARRLGTVTRAPAMRRLRLLLVDDSVIAREAEAALLRALGHEIDEAADGEEGWKKLLEGGHDALVTDVQMPVLDGIELTRRAKGSLRFRSLPIVILSSLSAPHERKRGLDAGADAYLAKSELDGDLLAGTLERLCGVVR